MAYDPKLQDLIDRYVFQATRFLLPKNKQAIEAKVLKHIDELLTERARGQKPDADDFDVVLKKLGHPWLYAAKYGDSARYLIGPALFPLYFRVAVIAVGAIAAITFIASLVGVIQGHGHILSLFNFFGAALSAFGVVTVVFALIEWSGQSADKLLSDSPQLPPVPKRKDTISLAEPIMGLVGSFLLFLFFVLIPERVAIISLPSQSTFPILDIEAVRAVQPFILFVIAVAILEQIIILVDRRYSIRVMIAKLISHLITFPVTVYILLTHQLIDQKLFDRAYDRVEFLQALKTPDTWWRYLVIFFLVVTACGIVIDIIATIAKTVRYHKL